MHPHAHLPNQNLLLRAQGGSRASEELLAAPLTPQTALVVLEVQTLAERGAALHRLVAAQGLRRLHLSLVQGRWVRAAAGGAAQCRGSAAQPQ